MEELLGVLSFSYVFLLFMGAAGNKMVGKSHGALLLLSKLKSEYESAFGDSFQH